MPSFKSYCFIGERDIKVGTKLAHLEYTDNHRALPEAPVAERYSLLPVYVWPDFVLLPGYDGDPVVGRETLMDCPARHVTMADAADGGPSSPHDVTSVTTYATSSASESGSVAEPVTVGTGAALGLYRPIGIADVGYGGVPVAPAPDLTLAG